MAAAANETCGGCHFWHRAKSAAPASYHGACRRWVPQVVTLGQTDESGRPITWSAWPRTVSTDYCGEFRKASG